MTIPYGLLSSMPPELTPGGAPPQPPMTGPPDAGPPMQPQAPPSLLDKLRAVAPAVFKHIQDGASNLFSPPDGLQGFLSEHDVGNARNKALLDFGLSMLAQSGPHDGHPAGSTLSAIGNAGKDAEGSFQSSLGQSLQAMSAGLGTAQNLRVLQARAQMQKQFPAAQNETPSQTIDRLRQMYAYAVSHGDLETAKDTGDAIGKMAESDPRYMAMKFYKEPIRVPNGANDDLYDPYNPTSKIGSVPHNATPEEVKKVAMERERLSMEQGQQGFTRENTLANDFTSRTSDFAHTGLAYNTLQSLKPQALAGNAKAQLGVLEQVLRMVNPGATVRPGVIAVAHDQRGVSDEIAEAYNKVVSHGGMGQKELQRYLDTADNIVKGAKEQYQPISDFYTQRAKASGVDPSRVIIDPFAASTTAPGTTPKPSTINIQKYIP